MEDGFCSQAFWVYSLGRPVPRCLLLPRGMADCQRGVWKTSERKPADLGEYLDRCLTEPPEACTEPCGAWQFSLGNFQEALKYRQDKGGCPILEVQSLVIYSSTWALELQSHKYITHSALSCIKEDWQKKGGRRGGIAKLRRSLGVTGLQTWQSPPSFSL